MGCSITRCVSVRSHGEERAPCGHGCARSLGDASPVVLGPGSPLGRNRPASTFFLSATAPVRLPGLNEYEDDAIGTPTAMSAGSPLLAVGADADAAGDATAQASALQQLLGPDGCGY